MKTWKYFAGVLTLMMVVTMTMAGALTAYAEGTGEEPPTSSDVSEITPGEGTSSEPPVSSEPSHTHQYKEVVTEPTCTKGGYTTYTCECGDSKTGSETDPLGHNLSWTPETSASCTEPGLEKGACTRCDHTEEREIPAKGHDVSRWETTQEPDCKNEGVQTGYCSRCDYTEMKSVPAKEHSYTSVVTKPTCEAEGYTTHTCGVCGDVKTDAKTDALGHNVGGWTTTTEPGCTTEGTETGTCSRCTYTEERKLPAKGHDVSRWETTKEPDCEHEGVQTGYCSRCTYTDTKPIPANGHSEIAQVTEPTCTAEGYTTYTCTVCDHMRKDNFIQELNHDVGNWTTTTEPGCTTEGAETGYCSRCAYTETRPIPAKGHSYTSVVTKPTCEAEGYTTHTCACGDVQIDTKVQALGHEFGAWKVITQPTYTAVGTERRTCTRCDHYEERSIPKKPLPDAFLVKADNQDVTNAFRKNEHMVDGTVAYTVTKLTVSITEYGVNNTITFDFNDADGIKVSNGVRYTFTLPLVHEVDGRPITDYYTIRVVQVPAPVSSEPEPSSRPSSAPESEVPPSSEAPSSSETPSVPENPSSSEVPSVPAGPTSSDTSSRAPTTSQSKPVGRMDWMLPVAILMGLLCVAGIVYVIVQLLMSYGLLGGKLPVDNDADNMIDLFKQEPTDTDNEIDEIFHNKK